MTSAGFAFAATRYSGPELIAACALLWAFIVVFWIDLIYRIIPNEITFLFIALGFIFAGAVALDSELHHSVFDIAGLVTSVHHRNPWIASLLGILVGGGLILGIRWLGSVIYRQEAMGLGDVKFMAMVGAWLGASGALSTIFYGVIAGGLVSAVLLLFKLAGRKSYIPFGPFLVLGGVITLFAAPGKSVFPW